MSDTLDHGVRTERRGRVEVWTLDRPQRRNALCRATVHELGRLASNAASDASVRVVVITGAGDVAFSAGADLKERETMTDDDVRAFLALYRDVFGAIDRLPKPTIAAINGAAFGGGLELALACDLRVIAEHARIGLTETALGIIPGAGGTQRLTRLVGQGRAKELILLAKRIDAAEAHSLGLVAEVARAGANVFDSALAVAEALAAGAPIALAAALEAIDGATDRSLSEGLDHERACYERTLASHDRLEALAAFREKRTPHFSGN